jgi:hypothetical protein
MEAIKLIGTSSNGKLVVSVPEEYDNKELEIMIVSAKDIKGETPAEKENSKNIKEL